MDAKALINLAQVTWVADASVLGGRVTVSGRGVLMEASTWRLRLGVPSDRGLRARAYLQHEQNHRALDIGGAYTVANFKGRAIAVRPEGAYQLTRNPGRPGMLNLRWYHEFDVKNRLEGDSAFLTVTLPLSITEKPTPAQDWTAAESSASCAQ